MPKRNHMPTRPLILLLGFRKGAFDACLHLGFDVVVWDDAFISSRAKAAAQSTLIKTFSPNYLSYTKTKRMLKRYAFTAVIACKERAVVLAARLRQAFGLPGADLALAKRCSDKFLMKSWARQFNIPITPFRLIKSNTRAVKVGQDYGYPFVTKPRNSSGRRGLQLIDALKRKLTKGHLAEKWIEATECSVESFIVNGQIAFTNISDYFAKTVCNIVPAQFDSDLTTQILALNQQIITAFGIQSGMTHLELYLSEDGLLFGEVAIRPPGGYLMELISHSYGVNAWENYILSELNRPLHPSTISPPLISACWISHPGQGVVERITGVESVLQRSTVTECKISVAPGDKIAHREGVGEDVGRVIFQSVLYQPLLDDLAYVRDNLKIELALTAEIAIELPRRTG